MRRWAGLARMARLAIAWIAATACGCAGLFELGEDAWGKRVLLNQFSLGPAPFPVERLMDWELFGSCFSKDDAIHVTDNVQDQKGAIWSRKPLHVKDWQADLVFRVGGQPGDFFGDGFGFWAIKQRGMGGDALGGPDVWDGLGIFFDTYKNKEFKGKRHPYVYPIVNSGDVDYRKIRSRDVPAGCHIPFRSANAEEEMETTVARITLRKGTLSVVMQPEGAVDWVQCFKINDVELPPSTFFGITAMTGQLVDKHHMVEIKVFTDVELDPYTYAIENDPTQMPDTWTEMRHSGDIARERKAYEDKRGRKTTSAKGYSRAELASISELLEDTEVGIKLKEMQYEHKEKMHKIRGHLEAEITEMVQRLTNLVREIRVKEHHFNMRISRLAERLQVELVEPLEEAHLATERSWIWPFVLMLAIILAMSAVGYTKYKPQRPAQVQPAPTTSESLSRDIIAIVIMTSLNLKPCARGEGLGVDADVMTLTLWMHLASAAHKRRVHTRTPHPATDTQTDQHPRRRAAVKALTPGGVRGGGVLAECSRVARGGLVVVSVLAAVEGGGWCWLGLQDARGGVMASMNGGSATVARKKSKGSMSASGAAAAGKKEKQKRASAHKLFAGTTTKCKVCNKTVYHLEQMQIGDDFLHKGCFRCHTCDRKLHLSDFGMMNERIYCGRHAKEASRIAPSSRSPSPVAMRRKSSSAVPAEEKKPSGPGGSLSERIKLYKRQASGHSLEAEEDTMGLEPDLAEPVEEEPGSGRRSRKSSKSSTTSSKKKKSKKKKSSSPELEQQQQVEQQLQDVVAQYDGADMVDEDGFVTHISRRTRRKSMRSRRDSEDSEEAPPEPQPRRSSRSSRKASSSSARAEEDLEEEQAVEEVARPTAAERSRLRTEQRERKLGKLVKQKRKHEAQVARRQADTSGEEDNAEEHDHGDTEQVEYVYQVVEVDEDGNEVEIVEEQVEQDEPVLTRRMSRSSKSSKKSRRSQQQQQQRQQLHSEEDFEQDADLELEESSYKKASPRKRSSKSAGSGARSPQDQITRLRELLVARDEENEELKARYSDMVRQFEDTKDEMAGLRAEVNKLIEASREAKSDHLRTVDELQTFKEEAEQERDESHRIVETLEKSLANAKAKTAELHMEVDDLREQMGEQQESVEALQNEKEILLEENDKLRSAARKGFDIIV
ncbi:VIP36-like protein (Lectin mannose-binding 2-like) (LMAN2-like protein) [Durusdinium trenchii]|uniref:VIP36-like protein (Lectin mannose-binding 2-like) (LMAN2-like protein) n=1 Tax=Durusdinium trenchii TaxID=1381693 RepID=A0ABP0I833_9DINO